MTSDTQVSNVPRPPRSASSREAVIFLKVGGLGWSGIPPGLKATHFCIKQSPPSENAPSTQILAFPGKEETAGQNGPVENDPKEVSVTG